MIRLFRSICDDEVQLAFAAWSAGMFVVGMVLAHWLWR